MFQCRQCSSCFLTTEYKVKTISHLQYLTNKTNPDYKSETHTHTHSAVVLKGNIQEGTAIPRVK